MIRSEKSLQIGNRYLEETFKTLISIRPYEHKYLDAVLDLNRRSDSTNRTKETWQGNVMTGVLAFDGSKLIGMIPLEKRLFLIGCGRVLSVLWVSGAHVEPEYRKHGIGTAMDQKIQEYFSGEHDGIFVYRDDETSPAYKWYKKLGYEDLLPILSFKKAVTATHGNSGYKLLETQAEIERWEDGLLACFSRNMNSFGGFPKRHPRFWSHKLATHYYKKFYDYKIVALCHSYEVDAYAFLGHTAMKDDIPRLDILELIASVDQHTRDMLYMSVMDVAFQQGLKEIRIQLSTQDPHLPWLISLGFVTRYRFNILGKLFDPIGYIRARITEEIGLEQAYKIIIQTPTIEEQVVGAGEKSITLFAHDNLLTQILLSRCRVGNAVEEGRLVMVDGNENSIDVLESLFKFSKWRFCQIDYI